MMPEHLVQKVYRNFYLFCLCIAMEYFCKMQCRQATLGYVIVIPEDFEAFIMEQYLAFDDKYPLFFEFVSRMEVHLQKNGIMPVK